MNIQFFIKKHLILPKISMALLLILSSMGMAHAQIYKTVDKNGNVTFTDKPENFKSQALTPVQTRPIQTVPMPVSYFGSSNTNNTNTSTNTQHKKARTVHYALEILEPNKERAYRRPIQTVDVKVAISPKLQAGDKMVISLDGKPINEDNSPTASVPTLDLDLGEHLLSVAVFDADNQEISRTERKIYIIQHTLNVIKKQQQAKEKALAEIRKKRMDAVKPFPNSSNK